MKIKRIKVIKSNEEAKANVLSWKGDAPTIIGAAGAKIFKNMAGGEPPPIP
jgi:hypothetical protein